MAGQRVGERRGLLTGRVGEGVSEAGPFTLNPEGGGEARMETLALGGQCGQWPEARSGTGGRAVLRDELRRGRDRSCPAGTCTRDPGKGFRRRSNNAPHFAPSAQSRPAESLC